MSTPIIPKIETKEINRVDILLSRTYSSEPIMATTIIQEAVGLTSKYYPVFYDIFAIICLAIARDKPLEIIYTANQIELSSTSNLLFLEQGINLIRPLTQTALNIRFNNEGKPHYKNDAQKYNSAVTKFLLNIESKADRKLSPLDSLVMEKVNKTILQSTEDTLGSELPIAMLELYYEYNENDFVKELFTPIHQYLSDDLHRLVQNDLIIPHQLECNGAARSHLFTYCVEEFMY